MDKGNYRTVKRGQKAETIYRKRFGLGQCGSVVGDNSEPTPEVCYLLFIIYAIAIITHLLLLFRVPCSSHLRSCLCYRVCQRSSQTNGSSIVCSFAGSLVTRAHDRRSGILTGFGSVVRTATDMFTFSSLPLYRHCCNNVVSVASWRGFVQKTEGNFCCRP